MAKASKGRIELSKKTTIVLPDDVYADLQRWAKTSGRATANLAAFLVELGVKKKFAEKYPELDIETEG